MTSQKNVVVIGAGIVGLSIAWRLMRAGCAVSVIEGLPHFVWRSDNWMGIIRALRSSAPARPYIARLIVFSRLI